MLCMVFPTKNLSTAILLMLNKEIEPGKKEVFLCWSEQLYVRELLADLTNFLIVKLFVNFNLRSLIFEKMDKDWHLSHFSSHPPATGNLFCSFALIKRYNPFCFLWLYIRRQRFLIPNLCCCLFVCLYVCLFCLHVCLFYSVYLSNLSVSMSVCS